MARRKISDRKIAGEYFNGTLDELAIWNISLTPDQIRHHYEKGVLKLNLSYRTSNDSTTFSDWKAVSNNTLTLCVAEDSLITVVTDVIVDLKQYNDITNLKTHKTTPNTTTITTFPYPITTPPKQPKSTPSQPNPPQTNLFNSKSQLADNSENQLVALSKIRLAKSDENYEIQLLNQSNNQQNNIQQNNQILLAESVSLEEVQSPKSEVGSGLKAWNASERANGERGEPRMSHETRSQVTKLEENENKEITYSSIQNVSSSSTIINLPEKDSDGILSSRFDKDLDNFGRIGGSTLNTTMPEYLDGGNLSVSEKSLSWERRTLPSSFAKAATLKSSSPFGDNLTSWPLPLSSLDILNLKFSSAKNFISFNNSLDLALFSHSGGVFESGFDMLPSERGIIFQNLFNGFSSGEHLQNLPNHDSSAFESKLASADFAVSDNEIIDFDSHKINNDKGLFKGFENVSGYSIIPIKDFKQICPTLDCGVIDYITTKKKIKDVKQDDYVLSLDEKTGKLVSNKVNALLDMGNKTIYELKTESGRAVNTTKEHPYLTLVNNKEKCYKYLSNGYNYDIPEIWTSEKLCLRWVQVYDLNENDKIIVPNLKEKK